MAIEIDAKGKGVSVVTLAGHDAGNFLYTQDLLDLAAVLATCASDKDLRALVVTGRGNIFCGGRIGAKGLTRASEVAEDLNAILKVNNALNALRVPVIVAIEGQAFGFGFGLTAQADYAISAENAVFSLPEMSHGLPPTAGFGGSALRAGGLRPRCLAALRNWKRLWACACSNADRARFA